MKAAPRLLVLIPILVLIACSPSEQEKQTSAPGSSTSSAVSEAPVGKAIYELACVACHAIGIAGAPAVGDKEAWREPINRGIGALVEHAIDGYRGTKGFMPARGGHSTLTDEEVQAAVEYMVKESR